MECARQRYNLGHFISPFLWKMIVKMLTHIHIVVYTWWCWHIYKGDEVGVDVDQLGDETEVREVPQSGPDAGHIVTRRWGPASGQWRQRACRRRSSTVRWC